MYITKKFQFLVYLSRRLKCTIVITRCPSSVVSPSSLTFHIFDFSETAKQNSTKLDRKQDLNVYKVCVFRADRKNKMAALASDWLRHFQLLLWNRWTEFNETWQEARSERPLQSLCFSGRSEKQDGRPYLWLAETFSTSSLKPLNGIQRNLTGSKISMSSTKFVFFGPIGKQDGSPGLWLAETFSTFSLTPLYGIQRNLTGSKISTSSTKFLFFGPIGKNKMTALASDWLRHFRLLWNHWREFNETWQEARSQCSLPRLCFSGRSDKQDGHPGLWLAETFSTSALKLLNGIQRNLTGRKISMSSTTIVFFGPIGKTRWLPWPLIGWDIFDFSQTAERNLTIIDRMQDLNVLYQDCVFRADRKNKMATLASDWLRHFQLLLWNCWTEFNETWQEERSQRPPSSLCFSGRSEKQNGLPGQSIKKVAHWTQVHDMWPFGPLVCSYKCVIHIYWKINKKFLNNIAIFPKSITFFLYTKSQNHSNRSAPLRNQHS